jgi:hypothetical protein
MSNADVPERDEVAVWAAVNLLKLRRQSNDAVRRLAIEQRILRIDPRIRQVAEARIAAGDADRAREPEERFKRNVEDLSKKKATGGLMQEVRKVVVEAVTNPLDTLEAINDRIDSVGGYEAGIHLLQLGDTSGVPVGTVAEQGIHLAQAPGKLIGAAAADKKRKHIQKKNTEASQTQPTTGRERSAARGQVAGKAAVYKEKGNPDRMRWQSGDNHENQSEVTGQHPMFVDEPVEAPMSDQEKAAAAQGTAEAVAHEYKKKRNKRLVDASLAVLPPKTKQFLELRRGVRGDGWTTLRNDEARRELASTLLFEAYRDKTPLALEVIEEIMGDKKEELMKLYMIPVTAETAVGMLSKKLGSR